MKQNKNFTSRYLFARSQLYFRLLLSHPFLKFCQKKLEKLFPFIKKNRKIFVCLFIAFLISDLLLIKSYQFLLPDSKLPAASLPYRFYNQATFSEIYKKLWETNIFHTESIPFELKQATDTFLDPVLSSLPFYLKGTIIHANPRRSVATVTSGADKKTLSYQTGDSIEKQAEIKVVERGKVIFFNQNNSRLEYILIPKAKKSLEISYKKPKLQTPKNSLVKKLGKNHFQVKRSDVNDYLQKLPEIIQQARVVPRRSKLDGQINGYRFAKIDKGSIYENLGFQKGDVVKEIDGESIRSPEKALELFERLKGSSGFKILVEVDGKDVYRNYGVDENAPIN